MRTNGIALSLTALIGTATLGAGVACNGCHKTEFWPGPKGGASAEGSGPKPASTYRGTLDVDRPPGPHPRVLLTQERLATLTALKDANAPTWRALVAQCDQARREDIHAGYEAWDWANATLALAICGRVTKRAEYGAAGVKYFTALLDDKETVGDGQGGEHVVEHDDGYPMRTHGWLGAIAYDWLRDAPGMTDDLRKKAADRFVAWTTWFAEKGYSHDEPISNYYVSYFGGVAFAGLALEGEDDRAKDLRTRTQRMWNQEIVPAYRGKLAGGGFPEGWQYGDLVGALLAIYAEAENTAHPAPRGQPAQKSLVDDLPWLRETVAYHAHALLPDQKHMWDDGDWSDKPAVAPPHTPMALSMILPANDPAAKQAHWLAERARDVEGEEWKWLQVLADDPSRDKEDPRKGATSYFAQGTATAFARTDWSPQAVWLGLSSAPSLSDHQHLDAGHFMIVRGAEPVLIDAGGYSSFSSLSHNVVIVDDPQQPAGWDERRSKHDVITYKGNQGTWSDTAKIARFEDTGRIVYAAADYASAFNPAGYPSARRDHAVDRAEREVIFSRAPVANGQASARMIVYDRMTLTDARFTTTFILHGGPAPQIDGTTARFTNGRSSAWSTTFLPERAILATVDETNNKESDDRPYFTNKPPDGMTSFRLEVRSAPAGTERRFLHAIVIGASDLRARGAADKDDRSKPVRIAGQGVDGVALDGEAYVFPFAGVQTQAAALSYAAPATATRHVVTGLAAGAKYKASASGGGDACTISIAPDANGKAASAQGVLVLEVGNGCVVRQ